MGWQAVKISWAHSVKRTSLPRRMRKPGAAATFGSAQLVFFLSASISSGVSKGLSVSRQCSRKMSTRAHGAGADADGLKGVDVHQPHFDRFDTAFAQRVQGTFAPAHGALGTDGAVQLVFRFAARWWPAGL